MVNKIMLLGTLLETPTITLTEQRVPYTRFELETTREEWKNQERIVHKNTHSILAYGKTAEIICNNLKQSRLVFLEGYLIRRKSPSALIDEVIAQRMTFIDDPNYQPKSNKQNYDASDFCADDIPF